MKTFVLRRWFAIALGVIVSISGVFLGLYLENRVVQIHRGIQVDVAQEQAYRVASELQRTLSFHKMLADSIASAVKADPLLDQEKFETLAAPFFKTNPGILNIGLAKGSTVRFVYPFEENKSVLGLDYLRTPPQAGSFIRVREKGQPDFMGPVDLVQGGRGYIQRVPVFLSSPSGNDEFWGIVSVVTDEDELVRLTAENLQQDKAALVQARVPGTPSVRDLWGDPSVLENDPVTEMIGFGGAEWLLSVAPVNGWSNSTFASRMTLAITLVATALLLVFVLWARHLILTKKRSWEQLAEAIEVIDDGFALYDPDDRLVTFNSRYKSYYGASSDFILAGKTFEEILRGGVANGQYKDAVGREEQWVAERLAKHRNPEGPVEQLLDDGRWLKVSEAKMPDGSTVGFRVDVTELKLAQQAAEQANKAKSNFLNTVSHEIRTPLSAIIGFSSMVQNIKVMPEYEALFAALNDEKSTAAKRTAALARFEELIQRLSQRIDTNGKHLLNVINDILYWTRPEVSDDQTQYRPIAVDKVVQSVADQLSVIANEKGIDLVLNASESTAMGDDIRLKQLVLNLVGNALKFTEQGVVRLKVETRGDVIAIEVSDTGCGIPEDCFEKIFQPFIQLDSGLKRRYGGSGLGLTISRDIAHKHGGTVTVSSELGVGSTFLVTLPAYMDSALAA